MEYGLIGEKLVHSYSPQIHALLADYSYELCPLPAEMLHGFMQKKDFRGINVTIPYKKAVIPYCDRLSSDASEIQAVNTIVKESDGSLTGHNTDVYGFMSMLDAADICPEGKKAVILGSGGTSQTAQIALRRMHARETVVISRTGENDYSALYTKHADAQLLVNTTPVGMFPHNGVSPVDLDRLPNVESVADVIYNPEKTALILQAQQKGLKTVSGLHMLVAQARKAAELFTRIAIDGAKDQQIMQKIKEQTLNLILIGMPGCGKTTVGKLVAQSTNRPLIDTDHEIEKLAGKTIPEIFAQDGEKAFRDLEEKVILHACSSQGAVITTGGGAILRPANRLAMASNGRICMMYRPLDQLSREGRPLSKNAQTVERLWQDRKELYCKTADYQVDNTADPKQAASMILEGFYEAVGH